MFSTELGSDFKELLSEITPNFQENLNRAFKNAGVRSHQKRHVYSYKFDNTLQNIGETKIELSNIKFRWVPDFRTITPISVDLNMFCLNVDFKLGCLRVEGCYEANNCALQKLLPVAHHGKIAITFKDVTVKGRIGLLIKEDSFLPKNYDLMYNPIETDIRVEYFVDEETKIENKITNLDTFTRKVLKSRPLTKQQDHLGISVWSQLTEKLTETLHRQLCEVFTEFSVIELFGEEEIQLRQIYREKSIRANRLLDSLLCSAKDYLVEKNLRSIPTPGYDIVYRGKPSGDCQGRLYTREGVIQDLSTLTRVQDLSLFEDEGWIIVYGCIGLRDFKHGYECYESEFDGVQISGSIHTSVYRNQIFIRLATCKQDQVCNTHLDKIELDTLGDIDVDASGLASLSWLVDKVASWTIGNLRYKAVSVLEKTIKEAFDHAIANSDCIALLTE